MIEPLTWAVTKRASQVEGNRILERSADAGAFIARIKSWDRLYTWNITAKTGSGLISGYLDHGYERTLTAAKLSAALALFAREQPR